MDSYFKPRYVRSHFRRKPDSDDQVHVKGHYKTYKVNYVLENQKRELGGMDFEDAMKVVKQAEEKGAEDLEMEAEE